MLCQMDPIVDYGRGILSREAFMMYEEEFSLHTTDKGDGRAKRSS